MGNNNTNSINSTNEMHNLEKQLIYIDEKDDQSFGGEVKIFKLKNST